MQGNARKKKEKRVQLKKRQKKEKRKLSPKASDTVKGSYHHNRPDAEEVHTYTYIHTYIHVYILAGTSFKIQVQYKFDYASCDDMMDRCLLFAKQHFSRDAH